jgi:hypothetical protein
MSSFVKSLERVFRALRPAARSEGSTFQNAALPRSGAEPALYEVRWFSMVSLLKLSRLAQSFKFDYENAKMQHAEIEAVSQPVRVV